MQSVAYTRSERKVYSYCCFRSSKLAQLIHAVSHIPLSERQVIVIKERMFQAAKLADSDADITKHVNAVQDACISETTYRTVRMWKFCRSMSKVLSVRLSMESKKKARTFSFGIGWRHRTSRILSHRMFSAASRATDDDDVNARLGNVYNAALVEHGIAPEV